MKLSKPQLELLTHAVSAGRATCGQSYPPVRKLVKMGLATSHEGRLGGHWIVPTDAGREALNQQFQHKGE